MSADAAIGYPPETRVPGGPPRKQGTSRRHANLVELNGLLSARTGRYEQGLSQLDVDEDKPIGGNAKRAVDIVLASLALMVLSPLLFSIGILIGLTMGGPILFSQLRVGYGGRLFRCYKFRSMRAGADKELDRHLAQDPDALDEWIETQKLKRDPRVTPFGHLLRKSSLDELPQLWNVLRGDMSCVGPRPILKSELSRYGEFAADYMRARPGITGLWQVSGRNRLSYEERVEIDRDYARHWSMRLDFWIVPRTIPALLRFDGTS